MVSFLLFSIFIIPSLAVPQVSFPVSNQLPPVARVSQSIAFQFAENTFTSSSNITGYEILKAPPWLTLNGGNRSLRGSPNTNDIGLNNFALQATDVSGSNFIGCSFIVSANAPPTIKVDLASQLKGYGKLSDPTTILIYPGDSFSIPFSKDTFKKGDLPIVAVYALLSDRTPLPRWLAFDASSMTIYGVAPGLDQPAQSYTITLIATDVAGYSGVETSFTIKVTQSQLYFNPQSSQYSSTNGVYNISGMVGQLYSTTGLVYPNQLQNVNLDGASWLHIDAESLTISGGCLNGNCQQEADLIVQDQNGNIAKKHIILIKDADQPNSTSSSSTTSNTTNPNDPNVNSDGKSNGSHVKKVKLGVVLGIIAAIITGIVLLLLSWFCIYKRRSNRPTEDSESDTHITIDEDLSSQPKHITYTGHEYVYFPISPLRFSRSSFKLSNTHPMAYNHSSNTHRLTRPPKLAIRQGGNTILDGIPEMTDYSSQSSLLYNSLIIETDTSMLAPDPPIHRNSVMKHEDTTHKPRPVSTEMNQSEHRKSIRLVSKSDSIPDDRIFIDKRQSWIRKRAEARARVPSPLFSHRIQNKPINEPKTISHQNSIMSITSDYDTDVSDTELPTIPAQVMDRPSNSLILISRQLRSSSNDRPKSWRQSRVISGSGRKLTRQEWAAMLGRDATGKSTIVKPKVEVVTVEDKENIPLSKILPDRNWSSPASTKTVIARQALGMVDVNNGGKQSTYLPMWRQGNSGFVENVSLSQGKVFI